MRKDAVEILPLLVCRGYKNNFVIHVFFSLLRLSGVLSVLQKQSEKNILLELAFAYFENRRSILMKL